MSSIIFGHNSRFLGGAVPLFAIRLILACGAFNLYVAMARDQSTAASPAAKEKPHLSLSTPVLTLGVPRLLGPTDRLSQNPPSSPASAAAIRNTTPQQRPSGRPLDSIVRQAAKPNGELAPIDGALLEALPDFKDVELSPTLVPESDIRFAETNATAQARRDLLARIRFREMKHIALRDPELAELDKHVRAATTDRALRSALANYNERLYGLIRKLDPSLTPLIEERKAASFKGTGIQTRD